MERFFVAKNISAAYDIVGNIYEGSTVERYAKLVVFMYRRFFYLFNDGVRLGGRFLF